MDEPKKYLLKMAVVILALCSTIAHADQAADSFGTGFADALRRSMEMQQAQQNNANYQQMQEQGRRDEEVRLLREQVEIQKQQLDLQRKEHIRELSK